MTPEFHVVIPARFESSRLPGKLLMDIEGKSVLERVFEQAQKASPLSITIACDDVRIHQAAEAFGADVVMTRTDHNSGTDRIAEVAAQQGFSADAVVVNVQGDEPFIAPELIQQVARSVHAHDVSMATLCSPIQAIDDLENPNVVKVVRNQENRALYFSRAMIPMHRDKPAQLMHAYRHIGLYAYRVEFLRTITALPPCDLEMMEALEQLRALWAGFAIQVDNACVEPLQDINTIEDLEQARHFARNLRRRTA